MTSKLYKYIKFILSIGFFMGLLYYCFFYSPYSMDILLFSIIFAIITITFILIKFTIVNKLYKKIFTVKLLGSFFLFISVAFLIRTTLIELGSDIWKDNHVGFLVSCTLFAAYRVIIGEIINNIPKLFLDINILNLSLIPFLKDLLKGNINWKEVYSNLKYIWENGLDINKLPMNDTLDMPKDGSKNTVFNPNPNPNINLNPMMPNNPGNPGNSGNPGSSANNPNSGTTIYDPVKDTFKQISSSNQAPSTQNPAITPDIATKSRVDFWVDKQDTKRGLLRINPAQEVKRGDGWKLIRTVVDGEVHVYLDPIDPNFIPTQRETMRIIADFWKDAESLGITSRNAPRAKVMETLLPGMWLRHLHDETKVRWPGYNSKVFNTNGKIYWQRGSINDKMQAEMKE